MKYRVFTWNVSSKYIMFYCKNFLITLDIAVSVPLAASRHPPEGGLIRRKYVELAQR